MIRQLLYIRPVIVATIAAWLEFVNIGPFAIISSWKQYFTALSLHMFPWMLSLSISQHSQIMAASLPGWFLDWRRP